MNRLLLTRDQARRVDQHAIHQLGYPGPVLMENAGRGCVDLLARLGIDGPVVVLCGKGNNAGDGFVIARRLALHGTPCRVVLACDPSELSGDALTAHQMLRPCGVPEHVIADPTNKTLDPIGGGASWIVDALLGTGAKGDPRAPMDALIRWANAQPARRLAVDLPSGLDCDTGVPGEPTFRADFTATFIAPKAGFQTPAAKPFLGEVHTVDIGVPPSAVEAALCD
ncbi:NAD(P)H-hydrate epimerase [Posidoniimonas corsicana]|uniref:NAD(P)H-hydrate epimerase n=1 Tax=Posidoniimonas corsicana TaxID=1938618 RepID=UPI0011B418A3|nr:NAD(P)H-hydrate epimerase [Posidoniimonas corsicana]